MRLLLAFLLAFIPATALGQSEWPAGKVIYTDGTKVQQDGQHKTGTGDPNVSETCEQDGKDRYTDTAADEEWYCTDAGTNTWTQISSAGGSPPGGTVNQVQLNDGAAAFSAVADGTTDQVLTFTTAGAAPTYQDAAGAVCDRAVFEHSSAVISQQHGGFAGQTLTTNQGLWTNPTASPCWAFGGTGFLEFQYLCATGGDYEFTYLPNLNSIGANQPGWRWFEDTTQDVFSGGTIFGQNWFWSDTQSAIIDITHIEAETGVTENNFYGIVASNNLVQNYNYNAQRVVIEQKTNCDGSFNESLVLAPGGYEYVYQGASGGGPPCATVSGGDITIEAGAAPGATGSICVSDADVFGNDQLDFIGSVGVGDWLIVEQINDPTRYLVAQITSLDDSAFGNYQITNSKVGPNTLQVGERVLFRFQPGGETLPEIGGVNYTSDTTASDNPCILSGNAQFRWSQGLQTGTEFCMSDIDVSGSDRSAMFAQVTPGAIIRVEQRNDRTRYRLYSLTSSVSITNGERFTVTFLGGGQSIDVGENAVSVFADN